MKGLANASTVCITAISAMLADSAHAQWITFTNETAIRLPTGAGENDPALTTADPEQKCYAWGDVDNDGDLDVVVGRKRPLICQGGRRNLLLMNENGVLVDRTISFAIASIGVPPEQGQSQGFLDATNDFQVALADLNNDGWLDIVTAVTLSDTQPRYIGHPRVYMNLGEVDGQWQGFRYEYDRIPQLLSNQGIAFNPRFLSVAAGDVTGDGYADLYFTDHDIWYEGNCLAIPETHDMDNKLLVNQGAVNPGFFVDESVARMGALIPNSSWTLLTTYFSLRAAIVDMNGDGVKDVVRAHGFGPFWHVAVLTNPPTSVGFWSGSNYKATYNNSTPLTFAEGDLNGDGRCDLVVSEETYDKYAINLGNAPDGSPEFTPINLSTLSQFSGRVVIADLDNDGWNDAIITDQTLFTIYFTSTRTRIYRNLTSAFTPLLQEQTTPAPVLPFANVKAVYMAAVFDIDGDGWKDIILGRGNPSGGHTIGSTEVWMNNGKPGLEFTYPNGLPALLADATPTTFHVQIIGTHGGSIVPETAAIHLAINGGEFVQSNLAHLGGDLFEAAIPAVPCATGTRIWLSAQVADGPTIVDPPSKVYGGQTPTSFYSAIRADDLTTVLQEDFENGASGWTVVNDASLTGGAWEIAEPNGTWNEGVRAAPADNHTPNGALAFITGHAAAGETLDANDVDGGPTHLISPELNLAGSNAIISFARWFYSSTAGDTLDVFISNDDGVNWTLVKSIQPNPVVNWNGHAEFAQTKWITESFMLRDYITPSQHVRVRFSVNDGSPAGVVEAGIDDVIVTRTICGEVCAADITGDLLVNVQDLLAVINAWGACTPGVCPADVTGDGFVNASDLLAVITGWGGCD